MGANLDKLKKQYAKESKKGSDDSDRLPYIKFKPGLDMKCKVRLICSPDGDVITPLTQHNFEVDGQRYYGVHCHAENEPLGTEADGHCPICEFRNDMWEVVNSLEERLKKSPPGSSEGIAVLKGMIKEAREKAKSLYPKTRYFTLVLERGKEDEGLKIWAFGKTIYEDLMGLFMNPQYGDLSDHSEGFDITVGRKKHDAIKSGVYTVVVDRMPSHFLTGEVDSKASEEEISAFHEDNPYPKIPQDTNYIHTLDKLVDLVDDMRDEWAPEDEEIESLDYGVEPEPEPVKKKASTTKKKRGRPAKAKEGEILFDEIDVSSSSKAAEEDDDFDDDLSDFLED